MTSGPRPYYEEVQPEVIQDHATVYASRCYAAGIIVTDSWIIPAVGSEVAVAIADITNIPVGAYFYNPMYGHLKISQWNPQTGTIGLLNENVSGSAAPGSAVPANTLFLVAAKPCCEDDTSTLFPFLAEDFIAPANGVEITIEVTSTFGLRLGDLVRVGSGVYRLNLINSSKQIVIENEGAGITPGTTVEALDADGEYQYLIVSEVASTCSSPTADTGRLVICDGNNERILNGTLAGQVPVLQSSSTEVVAFDFLDADVRVCTELTAILNVTAANPNYVLSVADTAGFATSGNASLILVNFGNLRFAIDSIGPNTLTVHSIPGNPGVNVSYPIGTSVCRVLSAEILEQQLYTSGSGLQSQINAINTQIGTINTNIAAETAARIAADIVINTEVDGLVSKRDSVTSTGITPGSLTTVGATKHGNNASIVMTNTGVRNMHVMIGLTFSHRGLMDMGAADTVIAKFFTRYEIVTGAIGSTVFGTLANPIQVDRTIVVDDTGDTPTDISFTRFISTSIPPTEEVRITAACYAEQGAGVSGGTWAVTVLRTDMDVLGVAV